MVPAAVSRKAEADRAQATQRSVRRGVDDHLHIEFRISFLNPIFCFPLGVRHLAGIFSPPRHSYHSWRICPYKRYLIRLALLRARLLTYFFMHTYQIAGSWMDLARRLFRVFQEGHLAL